MASDFETIYFITIYFAKGFIVDTFYNSSLTGSTKLTDL